MTNDLKQPQTSGSEGSELTKRKSAKSSAAVAESEAKTVRLKSLVKDGGEHPGTGSYIPPIGEIFEADGVQGRDLVACGLAELAAEAVKGE